MTQKNNISNISRSALSFFLPFGLMSITGLTPGRTVLVLLILITGNLLGALWADRFGFKSLMVWSAGFFWGALFLMLSHYTVLMKQFNFKNIESMWGHPILMFLGGAVANRYAGLL